MLAERALFLSCSRLRLWSFSLMDLVMFPLVILRLLKDPGYLASKFRRFLAESLARDAGVPFFRRELRRHPVGEASSGDVAFVASSEDIAFEYYNRSDPL